MSIDAHEIARTATSKWESHQHPTELAGFLEWLDQRKDIRTIVEIGFGRGGTSWAMQQVAHSDTQFIAVDVTFGYLNHAPLRHGQTLIIGQSDAMAERVRGMYEPRSTLVFIDGEHAYHQVVKDAANYPARYQAFHDIVHHAAGFGVARFMVEHQDEFVASWTDSESGGLPMGIGVRECGTW